MAGFVVPVAGKALMGLIKALPTIGATVGTVGAGGAVVGRIGAPLGMFKTDEEVAKDRGYDLSKDTVEKTNKIGDWYRDFATGTDTDKINKLAKQNEVDAVNNKTKNQRLDLLERSGQFDGGLTLEGLKRQDNETLDDVESRLEREERNIGVLEYADLNDVDISKLGPNPSEAAVSAVIRKTDPTSDLNRYTTQQQQRSDDLRYQSELLAYQERSASADRALTREINAKNRSENIQLRMMDSSDRRADRNAAERRADRKERQLMILQMIKGIQQGVSSI